MRPKYSLLLCLLPSYSKSLSPSSLQPLAYWLKNPVLQARSNECVNDKGELVPCAESGIEAATCTETSEEYVRDKNGCQNYYRCVNGLAFKYSCPPGTFWNSELSTCDWSFDVNCPEEGENSQYGTEGILMNFDFRKMTPDSIWAEAKQLMKDIREVYDNVGKVKEDDISFSSVIKPLLDLDTDSATRNSVLEFASNVAVSKELRDASTEIAKELADLDIDMSLRKDVFKNIEAFAQTEEANNMDQEIELYVEELLRLGKRNGLKLPEDDLENLKLVKKRISELGIQFRSCLSEDTSHIWVSEKELPGISTDLLDSLERNSSSGLLKVTTKYPHYYPVIKRCSNPKTRLAMEKAFMTRCVEKNTPVIEELIHLRQEQADILGYKSHADYVLEEKMAKNTEAVSNFLGNLKPRITDLWDQEKKVMLHLKEAEAAHLGFEFDGKLNKEDFWYYISLVQEKKYSVDQEELKEYFPLDVVTKGMMNIYQTLLGLTFTKVEGGKVWHDDVELYAVADTASRNTIGYFFLDLYPRDGKYGHAAMWQLQPASLDSEGKRQKAVAAMVCNFPKPAAEKPSLLEHKEVKTYFHEFGHVMHGIASKTNTATFFGTNTKGDFVEAPSQMLENWVWQEESLEQMSAHYENGSPIPNDLIKKLAASKIANAGGITLRQLYIATLDQILHSARPAEEKLDSMSLARKTYSDMMGIEEVEGGAITGNLGHLVGYDAGYYGYLWSEVFSVDMFESRFAKEGILNPETGMEYREKILRPGGSLDAMDMLRDFIGREPNQEAFLRSKGLEL